MGFKTYGQFIHNGSWEKRNPENSQVECLLTEHANGMLIMNDTLSPEALAQADWCLANNLEVIWAVSHFSVPSGAFIAKVAKYTPNISVGYEPPYEFFDLQNPVDLFNRMTTVARTRGYTWVCPVTHTTLVYDYANGAKLRDAMVATGTAGICFCGYMIAAYLFNIQNKLPKSTSTLTGLRLNADFGLTVEGFAEYLAPLNIMSGTGRQPGVNAGMRVLLERLGFKSMVCEIPFSLATEPAEVDTTVPAKYPVACA
jgi:hypothetical protein